MTPYESWLDVALDAASAVGDYLRRVWRTTHAVQSKGYRDIVTDADLAAESIILERLRAAFPDHALTSEEAGASDVGSRNPVTRWLIDPIDGTTNFSRDNPNFCTSIAAVVDAIIAANPQQVAGFRAGKDKLLGFFVGQVMTASQGKANPDQVNALLLERLQKAD